MPLSPGTTLGKYEVRSLIGIGGMGEVYLAHDTKLRRSVALKLLSPELRSNSEWLRRFESEAYTASRLNHPNILTVYEISSIDKTNFIATEFVEGESLRQRLKAPIEFRDLLDIGIQIASALAAAHAAGIVHRDIKPENVMVRRDHVVKVLDFGLAKLVKQEPPSEDAPTKVMHNTTPGVVMGTANYLSPEQARGLNVDERSDIWSLGVVLYEMSGRKLPFPGDTTSDCIASILTREQPPLEGVPAEFDRIVTKALRKDRDERYQVIKDLLLDLKSLKQKLEFEVELERTGATDKHRTNQPKLTTNNRAASHPTSSAEFLFSEIKQHKRRAIATLAIFLTAATGIGYYAYTRIATSNSASSGVASIAVLPFENTGNDPNAEYLSDGISESVINALSQLPRVKVIARSSSFQYKGKNASLQDVANALGVETVLTGRVSQLGDNILISAELVNASDKTQMWGEQYNRKATDVLLIPSDISRQIAEKLRLRLTPVDQQRLASRGTTNPQAYELLLKARYAFDKGDADNFKKSIEYMNQAIQIDPNYALAYASLSAAYNALIDANIISPAEFGSKAEEGARKALELDDNLPEAHFAMAYVKSHAWEWAAAEREMKRALELNPNMAAARHGYSIFLSWMKRNNEAVTEALRARELDPLSAFTDANVGSIYALAGRYDESAASLKKSIERNESFPYAHIFLGYTYAAKGMYREAIAEYQEGIKLGGDSPSTYIYMGAAYVKAGNRDQALAILNQLQTSKDYISPTELSMLLASLGQLDQAFASLEKAYAARDSQLPWISADPNYGDLRRDPRYPELVRRIGLTP